MERKNIFSGMIQSTSFEIVIDDYNNDGNPDFALGYIRFYYDLFTITEDGIVKKLQHDTILYGYEHEHSKLLHRTGPTSFSTFEYNNGSLDLQARSDMEQAQWDAIAQESYKWA